MGQDPQDRKPDDAGLSPVKRALLERMARGMRVPAPAPARRAPAASVGTPSIRQRQMWLVEQLRPGTPVHNQAFVIGISGPLDARALDEAIQEVIRRHDTLRTAFVEREGGAITAVSEAASIAAPDRRCPR